MKSRIYPDITTFDELFEHVVVRAKRPHLGSTFPTHMKGIAKQCWATTPTKRPDAATVVSMLTNLLDEEGGSSSSSSSEADADLQRYIKRRDSVHRPAGDTVPSWAATPGLLESQKQHAVMEKHLDALRKTAIELARRDGESRCW